MLACSSSSPRARCDPVADRCSWAPSSAGSCWSAGSRSPGSPSRRRSFAASRRPSSGRRRTRCSSAASSGASRSSRRRASRSSEPSACRWWPRLCSSVQRRRAVGRAIPALGDEYVVAPTVRLPDGRAIRNLVVGPFGVAVIGELPPTHGTSAATGSGWEFRRVDGRWVPFENPARADRPRCRADSLLDRRRGARLHRQGLRRPSWSDDFGMPGPPRARRSRRPDPGLARVAARPTLSQRRPSSRRRGAYPHDRLTAPWPAAPGGSGFGGAARPSPDPPPAGAVTRPAPPMTAPAGPPTDESWRAASVHPASAAPGRCPGSVVTFEGRADDGLGGGRAERDDDTRPDDLELEIEPRSTRLDVARVRALVEPALAARAPAEVLHDIGDEDLLAVDPGVVSASSRMRPAGPTNGLPSRSSRSPGCSPTRASGASAGPPRTRSGWPAPIARRHGSRTRRAGPSGGPCVGRQEPRARVDGGSVVGSWRHRAARSRPRRG